MKDFAPLTMWTIFEEMIGTVPLIAVVAVAFLVALAFLVTLIRARGSTRFAAVAGAVAAVAVALVAPTMTGAGFSNLQGGVDWIALALVAMAAFAFVFAAAYAVSAFIAPPGGATRR